MYIQRSSAVCTLILHVGSEIAAADWSAEETRGSCVYSKIVSGVHFNSACR